MAPNHSGQSQTSAERIAKDIRWTGLSRLGLMFRPRLAEAVRLRGYCDKMVTLAHNLDHKQHRDTLRSAEQALIFGL